MLPKSPAVCKPKNQRKSLPTTGGASHLAEPSDDWKQLAFGARANSPVPICRSSNCHDSECSRCARRIMLLLKVVMVVSKSQYVWVKNADAPATSATAPGGASRPGEPKNLLLYACCNGSARRLAPPRLAPPCRTRTRTRIGTRTRTRTRTKNANTYRTRTRTR